MSDNGQTGGGGGATRWPRLRIWRPTGIRNGGLLLVLVALAAVMALVDKPPEPGLGRRLPGSLQTLPPPVGITGSPPAVAQPPPATPGEGERPASAARAHPRRQHPRPARSGTAGRFGADAVTSQAGGQGASGGPPVDGATPAAQVRVPPVAVRVTPPPVLGGDLPEVRVATPEVALDTALP